MPRRKRIGVAVRKIPKSGVSTSGDSADVVERPRGGLSVVMADGQGSGPAAKRVSNMVVARATALIAEGARDGAVARAVHDSLYAMRGGKIVCTLTILSVDLNTDTFVIARNGNAGALLFDGREVQFLREDVPPIGVHHFTKPAILECELRPGFRAAIFTDGIFHAGRRTGEALGLEPLAACLRGGDEDAGATADRMLEAACAADGGRPRDDMSLAVVSVRSEDVTLGEVAVRSIDISFPF
ncbi:MAG: PP2C family protein-serine/threonine phosphatase [Bacillota bacterium]